jgi:hypothetical protein
MRRVPALCLTLLLAASTTLLRAQENSTAAAKPPEHFYRLSFTVSEIDEAGKTMNPRSYSTTVATGHSEQIRTGAKIPVATGSYSSAGNANSSLVNTQFQYLDTGINFDIHDIEDSEGKLSMALTAEVSNVTGEKNMMDVGSVREPVIRQNRWSSNVIVAIGKPTVVFSSDNIENKGKMQVELTATRID